MKVRTILLIAWAGIWLPGCVSAQRGDPMVAGYSAALCPSCAQWNAPHRPLRLFGDTYFVGTNGLSALLITSPAGHVLIDGGLPNSAPLILENVRTMGFDVDDIDLIVNSHAHYDHAGGIAAIQRASGARIAATASSAAVISRGKTGPDDPQHAIAMDYPAARVTEIVNDGGTVRVGAIELTAHLTAGHTPGGTTWTWRSCEGDRCLSFVYADSQTPVSADGFRFGDSPAYPNAVADYERGFALLERLPCDVLITPHPSASALWERIAAGPDGLVDTSACRRYAAAARQTLKRRLESEKAQR